MDSITQILNQASVDAMDHLGQPVFIGGIEYKAIFTDEEYEDDSGRRRTATISVTRATSELLVRGNTVAVGDELFKVSYIPKTKDYLINVELKNA